MDQVWSWQKIVFDKIINIYTFAGPAQYNITGLAAKGKDTPPAMSLAARARAQRVIETPAPGEYHIEKSDKLVVNSAPKFTFGVKKYSGEPNNQTPGNNY